MSLLAELKQSVLHLLFPHVCVGCGSDILNTQVTLCIKCIEKLPVTNFEKFQDNPVEKLFWGRVPVAAATAQYYFTKESLLQTLMHQFKYKKNKELGLQLGTLMGHQLINSSLYTSVDALIPLPLFEKKERKRGYNQAEVLCNGMATIMQRPVWNNVIERPQHTDTQTKKNRVERWQNMEGKFTILQPNTLAGKHVLLVDDVVTTGATLEACAGALQQVKDVTISIACCCIATK
ncbi:MAG: hypothetical protein RL115_2057 [Bacteroidota bacterium]|jgi:ComF family protein